MIGSYRKHRFLPVCALATAAFLGILPVRGEVGVFVDPGDAELRPLGGVYHIVSLVEDPDGFPPFGRQSSAEDVRRVVLNEQGDLNGDGRPSDAFDPVSGLPIVAWARNSASGYDIVVSSYAAGAWSEPQVVAGSADDELDPSLVVDPADGTVHLFYWVDGATPAVMHREAPADLSVWSAPVQVSSGTDAAFRPHGVFHNGVLRVAYEVHNFGTGQVPRQVVLARREGQGFVTEIMAVSYHGGPLWAEVHSHAGELWVEWIDADDELAWIRLGEQGTWEPTHYESFVSAADRDFHVRPGIRLKAVQQP
jgi:hypothetical protein